MKKYFNSLSFFRILAFLSVFMLHVSCYRVTTIPSDAAWAVDFFFLISGFLYGYKFFDEEISYKDVKKFMLGKIKKLYPIYLLMIFLFLPWGGLTHLKTCLTEFLVKFLLCISMTQSFAINLNYSYAFNSPTWFISTFMFLMLVTIPLCIIYKKIIKNRISGMIAIVILFLLNIIYVNIIRSINVPLTTFLYVFPTCRIFEFSIAIIFGFIMKMSDNDIKKIRDKKWMFTFLEFLTILMLLFSLKRLPSLFPKYYNTLIWVIPNLLIFAVFSCDGGYLSKFLGNKIFVYLGNLTFSAYIVHQYVFLNYYTIPGINDFMGTKNKIISFSYILFICFLLASIIDKIDFNNYLKDLKKLVKTKNK